MSGEAMVEDARSGAVHNVLQGTVLGSAVQAGTVHGGVHIHQVTAGPAPLPVPHQLPAAPAGFVGRLAELAELDRLRAQSPGRCRLALITGPAGIGKSALALYWSAQIASGFRDGQLYADLGAFDQGGPVAPGTVLNGFLRALGVPVDRVPVDVPAQLALFRTVTADKRLLIVLDNALSAAQVRQLLPAAAGCMVVATARWRLSGLIREGATVVAMAPLAEQESIELVAATIGADRAAADLESTRRLVRLCAGVPIALSVTAARLAVHPRWSVSRVLAELADERRRLSSLSSQEDVSVQAAFDVSYQSLSEPVARCYRAVGLHPGTQPSIAVIAAALDVGPDRAAAMLDTLVEVSLLSEVSDDRYQMHDLLRLHARQQATDDRERATVVRRIAEWYVAGAQAADQLLTPYRRGTPAPLTHLPPTAVILADRDAALEWLERERANLVATVVGTAETLPDLAWLLAYSMWPLFHYRRHHQDRMVVDRVAVECAQRLGNRDFEARMRRRLAYAHFDVNEFDEAKRQFETSMARCRELGDRYGVSAAVEGLGAIALVRRRYPEAASCFAEELAICLELGERRRAALALINLGAVANALGDARRAVDYLAEADALYAVVGDVDPYNQARCHIELGRALGRLGRIEAGTETLNQALTSMRRLGSPRGQAQARQALGELAVAAGRTAEGAAELRVALAGYEQLGDGEADEVRHLLGRIPPAEADPDGVAHP
jgi:tetratricopeptide (TPR) repeat protein